MRHREAWAEEQRSPTREQWGTDAEIRKAPRPAAEPRPAGAVSRENSDADDAAEVKLSADVPREILVVASKLKAYIRARSGMNTSDSVMEILSARLRALCDDAIVRAGEDGRRTVMDRDF
jgi:histone H3/H4